MTVGVKSPKPLRGIQRSTERHWVGDGFPVRTLFSYSDQGREMSPFLLLDYAGPAEFPPTTDRLGVGQHPHRGFETVTIVYSGEVEHRDSSGAGGKIGPGDVQWMTAASGVVHEEFHGRDFAASGGQFQMVQLWVNLPAKDKMSEPRYQGITTSQIPVVPLPEGRGSVRVIAGELAGVRGPAHTFTPIHVWDVRLSTDRRTELAVPDGWTTLAVVLQGSLQVQDGESIGVAEVGVFDRDGDGIVFAAADDAMALVLCGAPIEEPIVGQGPFVMNSVGEIRQAYQDYMTGKMGRLS